MHSKYLPYVFTEQGVAMLSSVLNSDRAIQVNIAIMRAFVKLREILSTHKELALKLQQLEIRTKAHDHQIESICFAFKLRPPKNCSSCARVLPRNLRGKRSN